MIFLKYKWKKRETILFLERLEMYLSSGLEINKALLYCEEGLKKAQQLPITNVCKLVESGGLLSTGFNKYIGLSQTISSLIQHGELSGNLAKTLFSAKTILEKEDELFKKCSGAMVYPVVIGIFTIILTIGLIKGVMSQIIPMLKSLNVSLPFITKVVIGLSEIITNYGLYILLSFIITTFIFKFFLLKRYIVKIIIQRTLLNIPLIGGLVYKYHIALFLHSCGSLIESGVQVKDAYTKIVHSIGYIPLRKFLQSKISDVSRGIPFGNVICQKMTPSYIKPLLNAGEASGSLGLSIVRAGNIVDKEIEHSLKKLTSLIEPAMMIGMGCIVGSLAISIMLPIYDISSALQK